MFKKIFFLILLNIFLLNKAIGSTQYEIIASVNNKPITKLDLQDEIEIIKIINQKKIITTEDAKIALNNLIEEKIKKQEIDNANLDIDKKIVNDLYNSFLKNIKIKNNDIKKKYLILIKNKIKIDRLWKQIIIQKYSWKININLDEINEKLSKQKNNITEDLKEKMILNEKNKKYEVFSKFHLINLKKQSLIKYF